MGNRGALSEDLSGFYYCDKADRVNLLNLLKVIDRKLMNVESLKRFKSLFDENDLKMTRLEALIEKRESEQLMAMLEEFKGA